VEDENSVRSLTVEIKYIETVTKTVEKMLHLSGNFAFLIAMLFPPENLINSPSSLKIFLLVPQTDVKLKRPLMKTYA